MTDLSIAQALFDAEVLRAQSANFTDEWALDAATLIKGWGTPPAGALPAEALFARPLGSDQVAIVRVVWPRFHFLVLQKRLYHLLHDPFAIAERFVPNYDARGSTPELSWPPEPLPKRTVAMLDEILKHGDGPFLLGASQSVVDGGKIALERPASETKLIRDLWALLPDSVRRIIWPATYAISTDLDFNIVAMPQVPERGITGYLTEDQARDYPDSRYERHLQLAIETNDQRDLDKLFARKTTDDMIKLALFLIAISFGVLVVMKTLHAMGIL